MELLQEILSITPSREGVDPWLWRGGVEEGYSVKDTYKFTTLKIEKNSEKKY